MASEVGADASSSPGLGPVAPRGALAPLTAGSGKATLGPLSPLKPLAPLPAKSQLKPLASTLPAAADDTALATSGETKPPTRSLTSSASASSLSRPAFTGSPVKPAAPRPPSASSSRETRHAAGPARTTAVPSPDGEKKMPAKPLASSASASSLRPASAKSTAARPPSASSRGPPADAPAAVAAPATPEKAPARSLTNSSSASSLARPTSATAKAPLTATPTASTTSSRPSSATPKTDVTKTPAKAPATASKPASRPSSALKASSSQTALTPHPPSTSSHPHHADAPHSLAPLKRATSRSSAERQHFLGPASEVPELAASAQPAVSPHEASHSELRPRSRPSSASHNGRTPHASAEHHGHGHAAPTERPIVGGGTRFPSVIRSSAGPLGPIDPHALGSQNRSPSPALSHAAAHAHQSHLTVSTASPSGSRQGGGQWANLPSPAPSPAVETLRSPSPDSDIETSFSPVGRLPASHQPLSANPGLPPPHHHPHSHHLAHTFYSSSPAAGAAAAATLAAATAAAAASAAQQAMLSPPALRLHPGRDLNVSPEFEDPQPGESVISVWTGTWNLHAKPFPSNLSDWIPQDQYDLYVIGTEECENTIEASLVFSSKLRWTKRLTDLLGPTYVEVGQQTLQAIHIIAFVRVGLFQYVHKIETASVATGIGSVVGNKGAVAIGFNVSNTSFLFLNAHFAAHQYKVEQRNADFHAINRKMQLRVRTLRKAGLSHLTNVCDRFDRVFWLGDLNYRVGGNRRMVDALVAKGMVEVMVSNDQLNLARERGEVFEGFIEGPINFMPTYKYDNGTDNYDSSKKRRIPSYTDRILWKPSSSIALLEYDAVQTVRSSDHRPVFATFKVKVIQHEEGNQLSKQIKYEQGGSRACTIQ